LNYEYYTSSRRGTPFRPVRPHRPIPDPVLVAGQVAPVIICGWSVLA
jgi:hypothetical protein